MVFAEGNHELFNNIFAQCDDLEFCVYAHWKTSLTPGFNLVRRFSLLKDTDVRKIRNPRGPVILRLGKAPLLRPSE